MSEFDKQTDTATCLAAGIMIGEPRQLKGYKPYALIPDGSTLHELSQEDRLPEFTEANPKLQDAASLINYCTRMKSGDIVIFANVEQNTIAAFMDYSASDCTLHHKNRATLLLEQTPEFKAFVAATGRPMKQAAFAQFIEDNSKSFESPSGADLLEIANHIEVARTGEYKGKIDRTSSSFAFSYTEENVSTGKCEVPREFKILVPIYVGGESYRFIAKLRYSIQDGKLNLWFDLMYFDETRRKAFDDYVRSIEGALGVVALKGTPS